MRALKISSQKEVVKMKTTIVKQVKKLTTPFLLKPNTEVDVVFPSSPDITELCHVYGLIHSFRSPDPLRCHATGKGLEVAVVGRSL